MGAVEILAFEKNKYDRNSFDCGVEVLNRYCKERMNKEQNQNLCSAFVAAYVHDNQPKKILGYYTLSSSQIQFDNMPEQDTKHVPATYPIPTQRIGRLARDVSMKGKKMGETLLSDALKRIISISHSTGVFAVEVDAKDDKAAQFYETFGFTRLKHDKSCLILPMKTLLKARLDK
jgi:predicted GNAT family N-acyltransferase